MEGYIKIGMDEGAKVVVGGLDRPYDRGWYVSPTVFVPRDVAPSAPPQR
ncbi:hypothetical protein [Nonomuraea sp. JJY05]